MSQVGKQAALLDGIPVVQNATGRDTKYPSPDTNFRVHNLATGYVEQYDGANWNPGLPTLKGGPAFHVKAYGAKGDGVTDDTTAIQNCINAALAAGATEVRLAPGTYNVTSTITCYGTVPGQTIVQGIRLIGSGLRGQTQIVANLSVASATSGIKDVLLFWHDHTTYGEGGGVENLWISASGSGYTNGIHFHNWGHAEVRNVRILSAAGNAVRMCGAINMTLWRVYAYQAATGYDIGPTVTENGDAPLSSTTVRLYACYASACTSIGIQHSGGYGCLYSGCVTESCTSHGFYQVLGAISIESHYFEANGGHHLKVGDISSGSSSVCQCSLVGGYWYGGTGAAPNAGAAIFVSKYAQLNGNVGTIRNTVPRSIVIETLGHAVINVPAFEASVPAMEWRTDNDAGSNGAINTYAYGVINYFGGGGLFGLGMRTAGTLYPRVDAYTTLTYSASITPDARNGNIQTVVPTDGNAFTLNLPSNLTTGQRFSLIVKNTFGTIGALSAGTSVKLPSSGYSQPANGFNRTINFVYDGSVLKADTWSAADVPN